MAVTPMMLDDDKDQKMGSGVYVPSSEGLEPSVPQSGDYLDAPQEASDGLASVAAPAPDAMPKMSVSNDTPNMGAPAQETMAAPLTDGKAKYHDTIRSFDTMQAGNRGTMLALDPADPSYLNKLAALQTKEGLIKTEKATYEQMHPLGTPESAHPGFGGKLLHILGNIGNIAGEAFVPGLMPEINGSKMNLDFTRQQGEDEIEQASKNNLDSAQAQAHLATSRGGTKKDYEPLKGPDDKPMTHNGMPIVREKGTNDIVVITPNGPVPVAAAQQSGVPGQSTFYDKPTVDETKQPIGVDGVTRHNTALQSMTKGMTDDEKAQFLSAYSVKPEDTLAVQTKRSEDAKSVAQMGGAERDRALQRDIANKNHQDAMANIAESRRIAGQAAMFNTGINPANKEHLSVDNAADEMLVDSRTGKPIPYKMLTTLKPSMQESNRADFARSTIHTLDLLDNLKTQGKLPNGPVTGLTKESLAKAGLGDKDAQEALSFISLAQSAATGAHVGGRFNSEIMDKMKSLLSINMNNSQFAGASEAMRDVMQPYVDQGGRLTVAQYNQLPDKEKARLIESGNSHVKSDDDIPKPETAKYHHTMSGKPDIYSNDGKNWYDNKGKKIQ